MSTLPDRLLIGLTGRAGAGKTTVGWHLEHRHGFAHFAFADPIVGMISALFDEANISSGYIDERALKEAPTLLGFNYRQLAQSLGTEWGRALDQDFWLRVAAAKVRAARQQGAPVVISDVRFPNEAAWIVAHGGFVVRVLRDPCPGEQQPPAHESEAHWRTLAAHAEIFNYGSRATLEDQVEALLGTWRRHNVLVSGPLRRHGL